MNRPGDQKLTTVQVWRVGGIAFLILLAKGILPPILAVPAVFGDMAIGVTAPFIADAPAQNNMSARGFVRWQIAGILDLVVAVTLGVLSSPSRLGILAHGATTRVIGQLPMTLIPRSPFLCWSFFISFASRKYARPLRGTRRCSQPRARHDS